MRLPTIVLLMAAPPRPAARLRPPPWLAALRLGAVALLLLAAAGPEWRRRAASGAPEPDRIALVIDNGWAAAPAWEGLRARADLYLAALPASALVTLIATAPPPGGRSSVTAPLPPESARAALAALRPWGWAGDRAAAARAVPGDAALVWFADGVEDGGAAALRARGGRVWSAPPGGAAILSANPDAAGWTVTLARAAPEEPVAVVARDGEGRELARADVPLEAETAALALPPAARPARFELAPAAGPAGVFLTPQAARPPQVLIVDGARAEGAPPLLSGELYVRRALEPFAPVRLGSPTDARAGELVVLVDAAIPSGPAADTLLARVRGGAVTVTFAGPSVAARGSALSPVPLGGGARAMGGAMGWERPQPVGRWADDGPFAGLPPFPDAVARRQVLGGTVAGGADGAVIWAALADGTPLVSARRERRGWLVLVHTSADPSWSSLPLSGALQAMLRRLLPLAANPSAPAASGSAPWRLAAMLTGDGALAPPPPSRALGPSQWARARPSPATPPGLWRAGAETRALNLGGTLLPPGFRFEPLRIDGLRPLKAGADPVRLGPWLLAAALALVVLDTLLGAGLRRAPRWAVAALAIATPPAAAAQDLRAPVMLGVVASGDPAADAAARAGLDVLGQAIGQRTAVAPARATVVDPGRPGLGRYPWLYWRPRGALAPAAAIAMRRWLERGGLLLIDPPPAMGAAALRAVLAPLDPPPLERLTPRHVLARAFYRLEAAPLALGPAPVWVEEGTGGGSGRVARMVLASADWPALWRSPDHATRETALRFGINSMIYALTGDYKADRVHDAPPRPAA